MKKIIITTIMMGICALSTYAQETTFTNAGSVPVTEDFTTTAKKAKTVDATTDLSRGRNFKGLNISVQGGALYSMNENSWSYYTEDRPTVKDQQALKSAREKMGYGLTDLITPQAAVNVGYDFGHAFGLRAQVGLSQNSSAANTYSEMTSGDGFYPYSFNATTVNADAVFNISGFINAEKQHTLETKIYAGAGLAKSSGFDFTNIDSRNYRAMMDENIGCSCLMLRAGIIEEIFINKHLGAYVDANLEAITDKFNAVVSVTTAEDESFPYDLRIVGSFGLIWHF